MNTRICLKIKFMSEILTIEHPLDGLTNKQAHQFYEGQLQLQIKSTYHTTPEKHVKEKHLTVSESSFKHTDL